MKLNTYQIIFLAEGYVKSGRFMVATFDLRIKFIFMHQKGLESLTLPLIMKNILSVVALSLMLFSCKDQSKEKRPIVLGDTSMIVTETDERFLQNNTDDISPTNKKSSEGKITSMMMEVDSAKSVKKLEEEKSSPPLSGFTIHFAECDVVFDNLTAHAIQNSQDERTSNSVSYVMDAGTMDEMSLQVSGLDEANVEQRIFTRLKVEALSDNFVLNDLGKFISTWSSLAGKGFKYVSLSNNSLQFFTVENAKIKNAVDRELRKKKKTRQEIQEWMKVIKKTNSYSDEPCKIQIVSAQWRIIGKKNGKRVQKLIQFDIP